MSTRLGPGVARFNRRVTNHVTRPFARWLPGFGVVVHTGRSSGRRYRTPVNVFRAPGGYVIALTYGTEADWIKNVRAAGACVLEKGGRRHDVHTPEIFHDEKRRSVPPPVRVPLRMFRVADFMRLAARSHDA